MTEVQMLIVAILTISLAIGAPAYIVGAIIMVMKKEEK